MDTRAGGSELTAADHLRICEAKRGGATEQERELCEELGNWQREAGDLAKRTKAAEARCARMLGMARRHAEDGCEDCRILLDGRRKSEP